MKFLSLLLTMYSFSFHNSAGCSDIGFSISKRACSHYVIFCTWLLAQALSTPIFVTTFRASMHRLKQLLACADTHCADESGFLDKVAFMARDGAKKLQVRGLEIDSECDTWQSSAASWSGCERLWHDPHSFSRQWKERMYITRWDIILHTQL